ncbi:hypothetical protein FH972_005638 [Carpinus fangiana]|uniref:Uncharacterized protein n=1 Tax=Carpinus fangiana TaxID=176857 RepID=A0A5N6QRS1_9ROSI|nr:hypothetical protein FH972_005638 [Carpinus fangiana]
MEVATSVIQHVRNAPSTTQPVRTTTQSAYKPNASTIFGNKKKTTIGLAIRTRGQVVG